MRTHHTLALLMATLLAAPTFGQSVEALQDRLEEEIAEARQDIVEGEQELREEVRKPLRKMTNAEEGPAGVIVVDGEETATPATQQRRERMQQRRQRDGNQQARQRPSFDSQLAESLAWGNQAEIAISKLATEKAQNDQVRTFAAKMVTAHEQMLESLGEYADEVTDIRDHRPSETAGTQGQDEKSAYGNNRTKKPRSMEDVWADATAICLNKTLDRMKQAEGMDFDWAYTTQQYFAHTKMLSELEAMNGRGSKRFNTMVATGIEKTSAHLKELERITQALDQAEERRN